MVALAFNVAGHHETCRAEGCLGVVLVARSYSRDYPDHVALDAALVADRVELHDNFGGDLALVGAVCGAVVGTEHRRHRTSHGDGVGCVQNADGIANQNASLDVGRDESASVRASLRGASSRSGTDSCADSNRRRVAAEPGKPS